MLNYKSHVLIKFDENKSTFDEIQRKFMKIYENPIKIQDFHMKISDFGWFYENICFLTKNVEKLKFQKLSGSF